MSFQSEVPGTSPRSSKVPRESSPPVPLTHTNSVLFQENLEEGQNDNVVKILAVICVFLISFLPVFFTHNFDAYQLVSLLLGFFFAQWILFACYQLYISTSLSALRIINQRVEGFGSSIFPTKIVQVYDRPITSISDFAATRGSTLHISMLTMGVSTAVMFTIILQIKATQLRELQNDELTALQTVGIASCVIAANGFGFIGLFELNGYSKINTVLHYSGVAQIVGGLMPAFGIIMGADAIFYCVLGFTIFLGFCYLFYQIKYDKKFECDTNNPQDVERVRRKVHVISMVSVGLELFIIAIGAVCSVIIVYNLNNFS